jgi:hypothetical protein
LKWRGIAGTNQKDHLAGLAFEVSLQAAGVPPFSLPALFSMRPVEQLRKSIRVLSTKSKRKDHSLSPLLRAEIRRAIDSAPDRKSPALAEVCDSPECCRAINDINQLRRFTKKRGRSGGSAKIL